MYIDKHMHTHVCVCVCVVCVCDPCSNCDIHTHNRQTDRQTDQCRKPVINQTCTHRGFEGIESREHIL